MGGTAVASPHRGRSSGRRASSVGERASLTVTPSLSRTCSGDRRMPGDSWPRMSSSAGVSTSSLTCRMLGEVESVPVQNAIVPRRSPGYRRSAGSIETPR